MRNRIVEIAAAIIGVASVVYLYVDRTGLEGSGEQQERAPFAAELPAEPAPVESGGAVAAPARQLAPDVVPVVQGAAADDAAVEMARATWEAARQGLEVVEAELEQLDTTFDAKETEFAALEANGADAEALEEEMLIFLDGIVDEYDALETRLAEAEAAELAAAEHLAHLRGDSPDMLESRENGS